LSFQFPVHPRWKHGFVTTRFYFFGEGGGGGGFVCPGKLLVPGEGVDGLGAGGLGVGVVGLSFLIIS